MIIENCPGSHNAARCGSQYTSDDFQDELDFLWIKSSPAYVHFPECNGCMERFFSVLKENLLWIRVFEHIEARQEKDLQRTLKRYSCYGLLILDELGYIPFSQEGAEVLSQVLSERHEQGICDHYQQPGVC